MYLEVTHRAGQAYWRIVVARLVVLIDDRRPEESAVQAYQRVPSVTMSDWADMKRAAA